MNSTKRGGTSARGKRGGDCARGGLRARQGEVKNRQLSERCGKFRTIQFTKLNDNLYRGITPPVSVTCPDFFGSMTASKLSALFGRDSIFADAFRTVSTNRFRYVMAKSSTEGKLRHLERFDRNDPPPPPCVIDFIKDRLFPLLPRCRADPAILRKFLSSESSDLIGLFSDNFPLSKSAGYEAELLLGKPGSKKEFVEHPEGSKILARARDQALASRGFCPAPMRAAGRAKILTARKWEAAFDSIKSELKPTIDRLIWISPPSSLFVSIPGVRSAEKALYQSGLSTIGRTPFYGGFARDYLKFHGYTTWDSEDQPLSSAGFCATLQKYKAEIHHHLRESIGREWKSRRLRARCWGFGSDASRMDSSMREWWVKLWADWAAPSIGSPKLKSNYAEALLRAHCGGRLAMDGGVMAHVPEGASTGALGVSNLESLSRAFFDLMGVTRRLQREVLNSCKYFLSRRRDSALPPCVADLTSCLARRRASTSSQIGPGTPLFDQLFAVVLEFCRLRTNGDDDWLTSPLLTRMRGGRSAAAHLERLSLLRPECLALIAQRPPRDRNLAMRVLNRWAITKEHKELELPVRLNPEKGSEGPLAADYNMNSSRPLISRLTGTPACYNKSLTSEEDYVALTHPDRTMMKPEHSALRLASLSTLSPDPYTYSLISLLFQGLVAEYEVDLDSIPIELGQREANGSLYQLNEAKAVDLVLNPGEDPETFIMRFPSYSDVLNLHGLGREGHLWKSRPKVFTSIAKVQTDTNSSCLFEGSAVNERHDGMNYYDVPIPWDLKGELQQVGPRHCVHFNVRHGLIRFGH